MTPKSSLQPTPSPAAKYRHLKFTFHERLGPLEMMKEKIGELEGLEFILDTKIEESLYSGYINETG